MGCLVTFWQGMNYIIDCYGFYSNSAIAVNTFLRSIAGAGFPLFAPAMYHNLVGNYPQPCILLQMGINHPLGSGLGNLASGFPMRGICTCASAVLYLWSPNKEEVTV
jgi:hypothetical protein